MDGAELTIWICLAVLLVCGVVGAVRPGWGFMLGQRWWFRDRPEPSDAYLFVARIGGVVLIVLSLLGALGMVWLRSEAARNEARTERCQELLAEFEDVVAFVEQDDPAPGDASRRIDNLDEVERLADSEGVTIAVVEHPMYGDALRVTDPAFADSAHPYLFELTAFGGYCPTT